MAGVPEIRNPLEHGKKTGNFTRLDEFHFGIIPVLLIREIHHKGANMKLRSIRNVFLIASVAYLSLGISSLLAQESSGNGTARLEGKIAAAAQGTKGLASKNVAMSLIEIAEAAGKPKAVENLCQADLINASFSSKFRLRAVLLDGPTPQGCLTCQRVTYCPTFGECIFTGCGVICNPED